MPIPIHGKQYLTVAERLETAHAGQRPTVIKSVTTEFIQLGAATLCRATVTFDDDRSFQGTAEVPVDSTNRAEQDAPHECAETSAWGRALAAAGYPGSESGLAGAEEIMRPPRAPYSAQRRDGSVDQIPAAIERDTQRMAEQNLYEQTERAAQSDGKWGTPPPTENQQKALWVLGRKVKKDIPQGITRQQASELIGRLDAQAKAGARP